MKGRTGEHNSPLPTCRLCLMGTQQKQTSALPFWHSSFSCNLKDKLSQKFHSFVMLWIMLRYTKWEYWPLTIAKLSSVFKYFVFNYLSTNQDRASTLECLTSTTNQQTTWPRTVVSYPTLKVTRKVAAMLNQLPWRWPNSMCCFYSLTGRLKVIHQGDSSKRDLFLFVRVGFIFICSFYW